MVFRGVNEYRNKYPYHDVRWLTDARYDVMSNGSSGPAYPDTNLSHFLLSTAEQSWNIVEKGYTVRPVERVKEKLSGSSISIDTVPPLPAHDYCSTLTD